jgi:hypothetical protein
LIAALGVLCCSPVLAGEPVPPRLEAAVAAAPPVLDGMLDDACWETATHIEGFWRQTVDQPELESTEAWICYDRRAIYVAFRCHDSHPEQIRADQRKRQGSMRRDDRVELWLDVEDAGRGFYGFLVNPAGVQQDSVPGGSAEKIEWRGDWRAAARVDAAGWAAEIEVPFSILRYPDGQESFRFHLSRHLARARDTSVWPPCYARIGDSANCARWVGIASPPVPCRYVIMPYLLSIASENDEERELLTGGLDVKVAHPRGPVGLLTYNPDFSNIEDVVETIDFTFVERYLPEYRPFFQEGASYLPGGGDDSGGPVALLYTRRIGELDWGAKTFGTLGPHRFGVLDAYRRGGENHLAWQYDYLFGTRGSIGIGGVGRRVPGEPDNHALDLSGGWWWPFVGGSSSVFAHSYRSRTNGEGGDDTALDLGASLWRQQGWSGWVGYSAVGSDFRADDGYVPETGVRSLSAGISHERRHDEGEIEEVEWRLSFGSGESEDGTRRSVSLSHDRDWRSGWSFEAGHSRGERDGYDVVSNSLELDWNRQDIYRRGEVEYRWGERYAHPYRYQGFNQGFRMTACWSMEISVERSYAAERDWETGAVSPPEWARQVVATTSYDISEERTASARLVRRGGSTNVYAAYRQRVREGTDLLVVAGDPNAEKWVNRLAVKAIHCF